MVKEQDFVSYKSDFDRWISRTERGRSVTKTEDTDTDESKVKTRPYTTRPYNASSSIVTGTRAHVSGEKRVLRKKSFSEPSLHQHAISPCTVNGSRIYFRDHTFVKVRKLQDTLFGSAEEYRYISAEPEQMHTRVCIKKTDKHWARSDIAVSTREDPETEIRILRRLMSTDCEKHNVSRCLHIFCDDTHMYTVFNLYDHRVLEFVIKSSFLSERVSRFIFSQLLSAVSFLHERSIAHLDISLENLMIGNDLRVKIIDFGQAIDAVSHQKLFGCYGKETYYHPAMVRDRAFEPFDADVWACGISLFIMLTGYPPFIGPYDTDELYRIVSYGERGGIPTLFEAWKRSHISEDASNLLQRMLRWTDDDGGNCDSLCVPNAIRSISSINAHPWMDEKPDISSEEELRAALMRETS